MEHKFTFKDARNIFITIEKKFNVYDLGIDGVFFWKLIRFELFDNIIRSLNIIEDGHPLSKIDKLKRLQLLLKYSFLNLFKKKYISKSDVLLLTHGRKQIYGDTYVDIYLNDIINMLKNDKKKMMIIDRPDHYGKHYKVDYENVVFFERFAHVFREGAFKLLSEKINLNKNLQIILEIENELQYSFGIKVDLVNLIKKRIFRFKLEKKYFDKLLNQVSPEKIYLVVSYGKEELIASAKERGIKVVEVQHGVISRYHMGYYFPYNYLIPYFPDEIILFGDYWKESTCFPMNSTQFVRHFNFMKRIDSTNNLINNSENILFISQGSIGDQLSKVASDFINANRINGYCYYKLHPSEYSNWKNKYPDLEACEKDGRIIVITNEKSIYELFSLCKYAIGVYSTAIYESLMHGCKTYLVNIEGYQYMEYLIEKKYVKLISKKFIFKDLYDFSNRDVSNETYFYS